MISLQIRFGRRLERHTLKLNDFYLLLYCKIFLKVSAHEDSISNIFPNSLLRLILNLCTGLINIYNNIRDYLKLCTTIYFYIQTKHKLKS